MNSWMAAAHKHVSEKRMCADKQMKHSCLSASEHDSPLVESRGRRTSVLFQSHQQRPAGIRHVTCTRHSHLCRLLHPARFLRKDERVRGTERDRFKHVILPRIS